MTNCFNFSTILWILLSFSSFIEQYIFHPFRLSGPSRDESYFSAHSTKKSPLLTPWPSGFLPLPFRRRKRGTGLVNPAPAFVRFILAAKPSALARRSLSAFAGLRAPHPRLQTRNRSSPYSAGKRVNMEYLPLPQPLFRGGQGFYTPCHQNAFQPSAERIFSLFLCLLPLNCIAFPYP